MTLPARFAEAHGRSPEGVWAAPGRVNLIGEYTDLNEGFVLPLAIPQACRVAAARRGDRLLSVRSLQQPDTATVEFDLDDAAAAPGGWAAYPAAVARALEASGLHLGGADLLLDSDVPIGAGLSSSAALECSVAQALCALSGLELAPAALALVAQRAENEYVGVPCGVMDQMAAMCCTAGHALLLDTRDLAVRQVPFDPGAAGMSLLVVDTRVKHELASSAYGERRSSCEEAAALLGVAALRDVPPEQSAEAVERLSAAGGDELARRARHVLTEQRRVLEVVALLERGSLGAIGPLLLEGHRSLRDDFEVSCAELDAVVEAAAAAGAIGARMTGAGFGGAAIVLARRAAVGAVEQAVGDRFAELGFAAPSCFEIAPSEGARRES